MSKLHFRPHHFLCTLAFEGKGYSEEFVQNYTQIVERISDETEIQVVDSADSICAPCPNREGSGCIAGEKIGLLDEQHSLILGLKSGDEVTWGEAQKLIADQMRVEDFHRACAPCSWKSMGVCESALKKLKVRLGDRMKSFVGIVGLSCAIVQLGAHSVWAQATPTPGLRPLDELREWLHPIQKKGPLTKKVVQAHELLKQGKTQEARELASSLQKNPLFADYGTWLEGTARLEEGRKALHAHQYKAAIGSARGAMSASLRIFGGSPYSPWLKTASRDLATAELIEGAAYCGQNLWRLCREKLESGFQRLAGASLGSGDLWSIRPEFLEAYSQACSKADAEGCMPWVSKLTGVFLKNSIETKALFKFLPRISAIIEEKGKPAPIGAPKATKTYRAPDLDQAAFELAMSEYFNRSYKKSIQLFQSFLESYPRSSHRVRAQFWLAKAMNQDGQEEEAKKIYQTLVTESPLTFYGLLSAQLIGKDIESAILATVPQGLTREAGLSPLEFYRLNRAEHLLQAGSEALASFELKELKAREAHSNAFLVYLATLQHEAGNHLLSFSILSELIQRGYPGVQTSYVLRYIFPKPFFDTIRTAAVENKMDPLLLLSLIKQESSFEATIVSSVGAQGLTQLMPATALDVSPEVFRAQLIDVNANVRTGAKYLGRLLNRFKGNIALALASYNAGPNAVDRWVKSNSQRKDLLEFIESIPYRETREYVAAIIRNYYWYSRFFNESDSQGLSLESFWVNGFPSESPPQEASSSSEEKLN